VSSLIIFDEIPGMQSRQTIETLAAPEPPARTVAMARAAFRDAMRLARLSFRDREVLLARADVGDTEEERVLSIDRYQAAFEQKHARLGGGRVALRKRHKTRFTR
jgi:hypothetical protein